MFNSNLQWTYMIRDSPILLSIASLAFFLMICRKQKQLRSSYISKSGVLNRKWYSLREDWRKKCFMTSFKIYCKRLIDSFKFHLRILGKREPLLFLFTVPLFPPVCGLKINVCSLNLKFLIGIKNIPFFIIFLMLPLAVLH
jgi:hypothetical protein